MTCRRRSPRVVYLSVAPSKGAKMAGHGPRVDLLTEGGWCARVSFEEAHLGSVGAKRLWFLDNVKALPRVGIAGGNAMRKAFGILTLSLLIAAAVTPARAGDHDRSYRYPARNYNHSYPSNSYPGYSYAAPYGSGAPYNYGYRAPYDSGYSYGPSNRYRYNSRAEHKYRDRIEHNRRESRRHWRH